MTDKNATDKPVNAKTLIKAASPEKHAASIAEKSSHEKSITDAQTATPKKHSLAKRIRHSPALILFLILFIVICAVAGTYFWHSYTSSIYIEKADIEAPEIDLAPLSPGIIERVFVAVGDTVTKNQIVAIVANQSIYAKTAGLIIAVQDTPGAIASSQLPVVKMIEPQKLRLVGSIEEDKGLSDIRVGQNVIFTVDAFGKQQFNATVESISPSSKDTDIVFSVSDKRQEKLFTIKASYDLDALPQLHNGMSARMWVYK